MTNFENLFFIWASRIKRSSGPSGLANVHTGWKLVPWMAIPLERWKINFIPWKRSKTLLISPGAHPEKEFLKLIHCTLNDCIGVGILQKFRENADALLLLLLMILSKKLSWNHCLFHFFFFFLFYKRFIKIRVPQCGTTRNYFVKSTFYKLLF